LFISAFPGFHTVLAKGCDALLLLLPPLLLPLLLPPLLPLLLPLLLPPPFARAAPEATSQRNVRSSSQPRAASHLTDERGGRRQRVFVIQPEVRAAAHRQRCSVAFLKPAGGCILSLSPVSSQRSSAT
jgi:hypothetical protein